MLLQRLVTFPLKFEKSLISGIDFWTIHRAEVWGALNKQADRSRAKQEPAQVTGVSQEASRVCGWLHAFCGLVVKRIGLSAFAAF